MILIVGGAGYIGSHVNKWLTGRGRETVVLDSLVTGHRDFLKWGETVIGDVADSSVLDEVFSTHDIDAVMHFAAFIEVGESVGNPHKYYMNNVRNTLVLLDAMLRHDVNRLVFSSTCAVYGEPKWLPLTEDHPFAPVSPYGRTKRFIEDIMADYSAAHGLRYSSLRYFNAAGADPDCEIGERHQPESHLIPIVLQVAMGLRERVEIYGTDYDTRDGTCVRDYIHVNDLADAHLKSLEYLEGGGESQAFNLGNGGGYTVREVVDTARTVTGRDIEAREGPRRPGDAERLVGSSGKAREVLDWTPATPELEEIVRTAWNWHLKDGGPS